jgi:outer membrane receptor protein involved in Fe transport
MPVDSYNLFNLFARYSISDRVEFRGGVDNLLDEEPPVVGADPGTATLPINNNLGTTEAGYYDPLGRRYYVGFKMSF